MTKPNYAGSATSIGESTAQFEADGFTGQFAARPEGRVICFSCRSESQAESVQVQALLRTEGASDPDDMTAVAAVTCPHCSTKGVMVLKYGATATIDDSEVLRLIDDDRTARSGGTEADGRA